MYKKGETGKPYSIRLSSIPPFFDGTYSTEYVLFLFQEILQIYLNV